MKVYIREWLAGSAVAVVLEECGRYMRVAQWLSSGFSAFKYVVDMLESGSVAQQWP